MKKYALTGVLAALGLGFAGFPAAAQNFKAPPREIEAPAPISPEQQDALEQGLEALDNLLNGNPDALEPDAIEPEQGAGGCPVDPEWLNI